MMNWLGYKLFNFPAYRLYRELAATNPALVLYPGNVKYRQFALNSFVSWEHWRSCVLHVTSEGMSLYPRAPKVVADVTITPDNLVWFGRRTKYHPGINHLLVHAQIDGWWHVVEMRAHKYTIQQVVRAIKILATPEQITAYRRRPPHVYYGPVAVRRATQDIYGVWTLHESLPIYVMPRYAVLLDPLYRVQRRIPIEQVQRIEALRRMDDPAADGVVRFRVGDETLAFTAEAYQALANHLADAARRTLEDPIILKKKQDTDDFEEWDI